MIGFLDILLTMLLGAGVLIAFAILLTLERMHKTLQAILVHTIKLPNETARPTDSYL